MHIKIDSQISITDPSTEIIEWCKTNLVLPNPEYQKKVRMNLWLGNTPKTLTLYEVSGNDIILPFGCLRSVLPMLTGDVVKGFKDPERVDYNAVIPLYDYQEKAVNKLYNEYYGILQSAAGSGKTQMGIALISKYGVRALWLTHTKDLLSQSKKRAEQYMNSDLLGVISEGKVNIGKGITFATIQTMCKLDLEHYKDMWDCIVVDECHRVSGTPTAVTQFSKVLNSLSARHKYGLSATVHRADGFIKSTYALLGEIVYTVPDEAVKEKIMTVGILPRGTGVKLSCQFLNSDGTINYCKMINYLTENEERNALIVGDLMDNTTHYNLILSDRVNHLKALYDLLPPTTKKKAAIIDGKMTSKQLKSEREQAIEDMRTGKKHYLFATYALAKEGLDIPRLDRLYLTTPQKDYATIVQSVGRVARVFEGKEQPLVYDYIDYIKLLQKSYKKRCTSYRKCGCIIMGE